MLPTLHKLPSLIAAALLAASAVGQNPTPAGPLPTTQDPQPTPAANTPAGPAGNAPAVTSLPGPDPLAPVRLNRLGQTVLSPRISSITKVGNSMPHLLTGVGLVTGLPRTGSSDRGTRQAILNYIKQHGLNLTIGDVIGGSTALVSLTCALPPFAKEGAKLDVKVSMIGDGESLRGGELVRSILTGVDGKPYLVAQGPLTVAGFSAKGQNASVDKNPNAIAHLLNGGIVIREERTSFFSESGMLDLLLINPSPFNSSSVANGVRNALDGLGIAVRAIDPSKVSLELPIDKQTNEYAMDVLGLIGNVRVAVENPTKVTIDQVSGTVLAGEGVLISPCVVQVSDLTIAIVEEDLVSQPNPLGAGTTERIGRSRVEAETTSTELKPLGGGGATVADLLQNLKALSLTAPQLVQVFTALDQGGFLHATLEVR